MTNAQKDVMGFDYAMELIWTNSTKLGFSCRWYLGQGTIIRRWDSIINSSNGGIEVWKRTSQPISAFNHICDTRRLNRKLRKMILVN